MIETQEKKFKKGEIICGTGNFDLQMYNILYGRVAVYMDYGKPAECVVVELGEGDFLNVISFLESRPRNTTAVALEPTVVNVIDFDNFGRYFQERPAKIMSLLQHMSARIRYLQKAYLAECAKVDELEHGKAEETGEEKPQRDRMRSMVMAMFGSTLEKIDSEMGEQIR